MTIHFPEVCQTSQADDFLLQKINELYKALEERDVAMVKLRQDLERKVNKQAVYGPVYRG